jgi:alpha-L-fucosidase
LQAIGNWMKVNGESIYGTTASPIGKPAWGRVTATRAIDQTLYLHVFDWPKDCKLVVTNLPSSPTRATLLATGAKLEASGRNDNFVITLPAEPIDPIDTVIKLELLGYTY